MTPGPGTTWPGASRRASPGVRSSAAASATWPGRSSQPCARSTWTSPPPLDIYRSVEHPGICVPAGRWPSHPATGPARQGPPRWLRARAVRLTGCERRSTTAEECAGVDLLRPGQRGRRASTSCSCSMFTLVATQPASRIARATALPSYDDQCAGCLRHDGGSGMPITSSISANRTGRRSPGWSRSHATARGTCRRAAAHPRRPGPVRWGRPPWRPGRRQRWRR